MIRNPFKEIREILKQDISITDLADKKHAKISFMKMVLLLREIWKSVFKPNTWTISTTLAYKTLLAIVPILAISLSIVAMLEPPPEAAKAGEEAAQHLSYSENFVKVIVDRIPEFGGKEDFINSIRSFAENARAIAGVSFALLFMSAYTLLASVENFFNLIWQVKEKRPFLNKLAAFICTLIVVPVLMSFSVYFTAQLVQYSGSWSKTYSMFSSFLMTASAFSALYYLLPNTPVRIRSALAGGIFCGILFELAKFGFQNFAFYVGTNYTRIYGPLLAFPFILLWLWITWVIIIIGAEISFVTQNFTDLAARAELEEKGLTTRIYLAVKTVLWAGIYHHKGERAEGLIDRVAEEEKMPPYMIRQIVNTLTHKNVLRHAVEGEDDYLPAKDINCLTVAEVVRAIREDPLDVPETTEESELHNSISDLFARMRKNTDDILGSKTFSELVKLALLSEQRKTNAPEEICIDDEKTEIMPPEN
ncbi:MAG: YhjD/YihY/BrkB family envelope integrity protein [Planctomycetota bacterium]|jgi:membrane protein